MSPALIPLCQFTPSLSGSVAVPAYTTLASLLAGVSAIRHPALSGSPAHLLVATARLSLASAGLLCPFPDLGLFPEPAEHHCRHQVPVTHVSIKVLPKDLVPCMYCKAAVCCIAPEKDIARESSLDLEPFICLSNNETHTLTNIPWRCSHIRDSDSFSSAMFGNPRPWKQQGSILQPLVIFRLTPSVDRHMKYKSWNASSTISGGSMTGMIPKLMEGFID
jgi:hypothetical protein